MPSLVVIISDLHVNSTVALCPPSVTLTDGGTYRPNKWQKWLWSKWLNFWKEVDTHRQDSDELFVIINGDAVDGDHHDTSQIISRNMYDQQKAVLKTLKPAIDLEPNYWFLVKGTGAHVGEAGVWESFLADSLGAVVDDTTDSVLWSHLPLIVDGVFFDIAHHGRTGNLPWTESGPVNRYAVEITYRRLVEGERVPDLVIRSHKHKSFDSGDNAPARVISLNGWQFPTDFVNRIAPGELPAVGGLIVRCDKGEYEVSKVFFKPKRRTPWQKR